MACTARGDPRESVVSGMNVVRGKMKVIMESTRAEQAREKRAKDALAEMLSREQRALAKKRKLLDLIANAEKDMEKVEIQEGICKERLYFADQRNEQNAYMKDFLEKNKIDVGSLELTLERYQEKTKSKIEAIAKMRIVVETKEKEIHASEKREMIAKDRIAMIEEKLRVIERAGNKFTKNYTPLTETEYLEKLDEVKEKIAKEVQRRKKAEKTADTLEKDIVELEKDITITKKRNAELKQTTNELKGSRV